MGEEVRSAPLSEGLRANTYSLLAALLAAPPSESLIELLKGITPAEVGGEAPALGLAALEIRNDHGPLDPARPFEPFGSSPSIGSHFHVAHPELTGKPLERLAFHPLLDLATLAIQTVEFGRRLERLAQSAEVICSTVGPYLRYGAPLVAACVKHQTDYCDLTGETPFIRQMIDAHHERAAEADNSTLCCCVQLSLLLLSLSLSLLLSLLMLPRNLTKWMSR